MENIWIPPRVSEEWLDGVHKTRFLWLWYGLRRDLRIKDVLGLKFGPKISKVGLKLWMDQKRMIFIGANEIIVILIKQDNNKMNYFT